MKKTSLWMVYIAGILLLAACAGESPEATPTTAPPPAASQPETSQTAAPTAPPTSPTPRTAPVEATPTTVPPTPAPPSLSPLPALAPGQLACEVGGYACSLGEVSEQALARAGDLSLDAEARMRGGDSAFEVTAWLETQDGVVVEITDGRSILYRVAGSVPIVLEHPGVEGSARRPTGIVPASYAPRLPLPARPAPTYYAQPIISQATDVVGSQREDRNVKRALVLAPYQWQTGAYSDGIVAAQLLGATRWYKDNVTYVANAAQSDQNITIDHFMGWDQYDLIHVNTHGRSVCPEEGTCATYIMSGQRIPKNGLDAFVAARPEIRGIGIGIRDRGEQIELVVLDDFFRNVYGPGSLQNKVIYFSACEILAQSNVLDSLSIAAGNSDLFAWTNAVYMDDAMAVASALYERMATQGQSAGDAYDRVPDGIKLNRPSQATDYDTYRHYGVEMDNEGQVRLIDRTQTTDFQHHSLGTETYHVREVITLLHPESKATLEPGATYPINGTLGDGKPERIELTFRVEGYTQPEIEKEDITISFLLDGQPLLSYRAFLPDQDNYIEVKAEGEFAWWVQFEEIEIPDQQPGAALTFRAELHLPGGAPSVHEVDPVTPVQRDVLVTLGRPPLKAGQSYTIFFDRESQVARADLSAEGQQMSVFYDQVLGRSYYPDPRGGYWYVDGDLGRAFTALIIPVEWPASRLQEGGFAHDTYPCGEERCDRFTARQDGVEMVLSYDERALLVELELSSSEGGGTIYYEYEPVTVTAPTNASPAPAPIPLLLPSLPIPDLP